MAPGARGYGRNGPRRSKYQEVDSGRGSTVYRTTAEEKGKWIEAARSAADAATRKAEQKKQVSSSPVPKMEIAAPPGLSLPPRHSEALLQTEATVVDPEDFVKVLGARSLPSALTSDDQLQESFDTAVLSCVESFYRDRIMPTVGELQQRLREMKWSSCEVQAVLAWCARKPDTYDLSPPGHDKPCLILLRDPPEWFKGWVHDEEAEDTYSEDAWGDLRNVLKIIVQESPNFRFPGGLSQLASLVHKSKTGSHVGSLSLGEIRHMLRLGLGPHHHYFTYDASHGGRLTMPSMRGICEENSTPTPVGLISSDACDVSHVATPTRSVPKALRGTPGKTSGPNPKQGTPSPASPPVKPETVEQRVLEMLRNRLLPEGLGANNRRLRALRSCVDSLYRDRIEPSLSEVQQRLLKKGWTFQEVQGLLPLCARQTNEYDIKLPVDGCQVRILLRSPPSWFEGWISEGKHQQRNSISPDVWDVLAAFLKAECPSLAGSINGAAQDLRQLSLPGPLQQMSLGELREVVRCSIEDHGLLRYWEGGLVPTEITVQPKHVDAATPDKRRVYSCI